MDRRKKKAIAISEVIVNTAAGIANTWANYASIPVYGQALAAVMTALITATSAIQIATISAQQFKKGGAIGLVDAPSHDLGGGLFTVKNKPNYVGEYEGGEFIFSKENTNKNLKWFEKINKNNLSLDSLIKSIVLTPLLSNTLVNQNGELERRMERVEKAINDLPSKMPKAEFRADSRGLSMRMKQIQDNENNWKR